MRLRSKVAGVLLAASLAAIPAVVAAGPALAAGGICEQGGVGLCLNDWNGAGNGGAIKMGQNSFNHQNFTNYLLSNLCNNGQVTNTCPFSNHSLDSAMLGDEIVAILNNDNALCIGTSSTTRGAIMTACPNTFGNGGGTGTIMIQRTNVNNCFAQNDDTQLTDRFWSDHDGTIANLTGSTAVGNQAAMFNHIEFNIACWGSG